MLKFENLKQNDQINYVYKYNKRAITYDFLLTNTKLFFIGILKDIDSINLKV